MRLKRFEQKKMLNLVKHLHVPYVSVSVQSAIEIIHQLNEVQLLPGMYSLKCYESSHWVPVRSASVV